MSEVAGWGIPPWLPERVARRCVRDDATEAKAAREAELAREERAEARRAEVMAAYVSERHALGDSVDLMALAQGASPGRTIADILAAAVAAGDREDMVTEARLRRDGHGGPEPLHVEFGEPVLLQARSETGRKIFNRARHFRDMLAARHQLAEAERAAEASRHDYGLVDGVTIRPREDRDAVVFARHAAASRPVSYR